MMFLLIRTLILVTFVLSNLFAFTRCFRILCFYDFKYKHIKDLQLYFDHDYAGISTHLVSSYATVNGSGFNLDELFVENLQFNMARLREVNPRLKILVSLGSLSVGPESLIKFAHNQTMQNKFANKLTEFVRFKKFDGVHLEWSNFAAKVYRYYNKTKFLNLAKAIRAALIRSKLTLTISLPAFKKQIDQGYMVKDLAKVVDFITIRTLDMRTARDKKVGLSSALFSHSKAVGDDRFLSVDWVVRYYQSLGVPAAKINVAIPTYAVTFTLASDRRTDIGHAAVSPGYPGWDSLTAGILSYPELCNFIRHGGTIFNVPSQHGRFFVKENQWYSFDDMYSVIQKSCYAKRKGIGGFSFWNVQLDDLGFYFPWQSVETCGDGSHPLINTAVNTMRNPGLSLCTPANSYSFVNVPTAPDSTTTPVPDQPSNTNRVVCYYISWAYYRKGKGQFLPESIDPKLCTHIVYAYAWVINNKITPLLAIEESLNWRKGMFYRVVQMREKNPQLKVLLAVGGYGAGSSGFENVSRNAETRRLFSTHAIKFLRDRQFDGLEVDWQYVTANYKLNNVLLLQELRYAFDGEAKTTRKPRLLLSTTLPAGKRRIDEGFRGQLQSIVNFVDFVSALTYDFHGSWDIDTGFNCPLYGNRYESGEAATYNVDWVVKYYVSLGVPKRLMNVGIATYGRSFTLKYSRYDFVGAPVRGIGKPGNYTKKAGILSYYEICDFIDSGAQKVYVPEQKAVYAVKDDQWVGFDDERTVSDKACYALKEGYGGVVIWSLDHDDFNGQSCDRRKYVLTDFIFFIVGGPYNYRFVCSNLAFSKQASGAHQRPGNRALLYFSLLLPWVLPGRNFT